MNTESRELLARINSRLDSILLDVDRMEGRAGTFRSEITGLKNAINTGMDRRATERMAGCLSRVRVMVDALEITANDLFIIIELQKALYNQKEVTSVRSDGNN